MSLPTRVLVTGGVGFLGIHLVSRLRALGVEVRIVDDLSSGRREHLPKALQDVPFFAADVRDRRALDPALEGCDAVVHLADRPAVGPDAREAIEVAGVGTWNLLEAARAAKVARVVLASSCAVYGASGAPPLGEGRPPGPVSLDGAAKAGAEAVVRSFAEQGAFEAVALRLFHVYGRGRVSSPRPGVLAEFGREVAAGRPPPVHGSGEATRDFVHVDDAVEAFRLALDRRLAAWTLLNVGTGVATSVRSAGEAVCTALGRSDLEPISVDPPPGPQVSSFADGRLARSVLGFGAKVSLAEGLARKDFHLPFETGPFPG